MAHLTKQQLACEEMSPNPNEPAGPTFPFTTPGIVKVRVQLSPSGRETCSQYAVAGEYPSVSPQFKENNESLLVLHNCPVNTKQINNPRTTQRPETLV